MGDVRPPDAQDGVGERSRWRLAMARPRVRATLAALCMVALASGVGAGWIWLKLRSGECVPLPHEDLTIDEMIAVKRRVEQHMRDAATPIELSAREANFILGDIVSVPMRVSVDGDQVDLRISEGEGQRCTRVDFQGELSVHDGVARLIPTRLVVGSLDVSLWGRGRPIEISASELEGTAAAVLTRTRELRVEDGRLVVRMDHPEALW